MNAQTQEALHKALKVLNCLNNDRVYETAWVKGAINACEEALAQPAQEPVAWRSEGGVLTEAKLQAQSWISHGGKAIPLYTHPAPSWQGLTAKEIASIPLNEYTVQTVERMLKEKNT